MFTTCEALLLSSKQDQPHKPSLQVRETQETNVGYHRGARGKWVQ